MNIVDGPKENLKLNFLFNLNLHNYKISINDFSDGIKNQQEIYKSIKSVDNSDKNFHLSLLLHSTNKKYFNNFIHSEGLIFEKKLKDLDGNEKEKIFKKQFLRHLKKFNGNIIERETYFSPEENSNLKISSDIQVHFSKLLNRVRKHEIFIEGGYKNLEINLYDDILIFEYKSYLRRELERINKIHLKQYDRRIFKLQYLFNAPEKKPTQALQFNLLMEKLPPCIFNMIVNFKRERRMDYTVRTTINRFFKNANISIDDTIAFYKQYYNCTEEQFKKYHLYHIKHDYGLEGKKINYYEKRCSFLISEAYLKNRFGCPWVVKTYEKNIFKDYERHFKVDVGDIEDVNCMGKCKKLYERIRDRSIEEIETPIDFIK